MHWCIISKSYSLHNQDPEAAHNLRDGSDSETHWDWGGGRATWILFWEPNTRMRTCIQRERQADTASLSLSLILTHSFSAKSKRRSFLPEISANKKEHKSCFKNKDKGMVMSLCVYVCVCMWICLSGGWGGGDFSSAFLPFCIHFGFSLSNGPQLCCFDCNRVLGQKLTHLLDVAHSCGCGSLAPEFCSCRREYFHTEGRGGEGVLMGPSLWCGKCYMWLPK